MNILRITFYDEFVHLQKILNKLPMLDLGIKIA